MTEELTRVYQEAIALTEAQTQAIARDDWQELAALLMKRDRLIARAEALIHDGQIPGDRQEVVALLNQLRMKDEVNQGLVSRKLDALRGEMHALQQSNTAMAGYLNSLQGVTESHFIDHDQ